MARLQSSTRSYSRPGDQRTLVVRVDGENLAVRLDGAVVVLDFDFVDLTHRSVERHPLGAVHRHMMCRRKVSTSSGHCFPGMRYGRSS